MRRRWRALLAALLAVLAAPGPVGAHDHVPPRVVLRAQGGTQSVDVTELGWARALRGRECVATFVLGAPPYFPEPLVVRPGRFPVTIRFHKRHRPGSLTIRASRVDPTTAPAPVPELPSYRLQERRRNGRTVAWDAVFEPVVVGDYYLEIHVEWRDRERCRFDQYLFGTFHLRGLASAAT